MKHATLAVLAAVFLAAGTGCHGLKRCLWPGWGAHCGGCGACETCYENAPLAEMPEGEIVSGHENCASCRAGRLAGRHAQRAAMHGQGPIGPAGPPTGAVTYPYYTTRAPRDFLMDNPPSIGR